MLSSRLEICRLTADWLRLSVSPALVKLPAWAIDRVAEQVHQNLLEFVPIGEQLGQIRIQLRHQLQIVRLDQWLDSAQAFIDQRGEGEIGRVKIDPARLDLG